MLFLKISLSLLLSRPFGITLLVFEFSKISCNYHILLNLFAVLRLYLFTTCINYILLTYSSSFLVEHRSSTRVRHLTLFCAVPFAPFHVRCFLSNSAILVRSQVCRGLPLFRFPCGFHSSALFTTCPSGLLNVWPIHLQALCLISCSIGRCPVCLQSSLLLIFLGHQIRKMFLRLLLMNTCNFCSNPLVSLQVSEPYKSTAFTFDPKTLSLVLVVSAVDHHIGLSIANACLAFPIRA